MAPRKTAAAPVKTKQAAPQQKSVTARVTHKGHPHPHSKPVTVAAIPSEPDALAEALQQEQDDLHEQGNVTKAAAEFIDPAPGYNKDQVEHMKEYYGL